MRCSERCDVLAWLIAPDHTQPGDALRTLPGGRTVVIAVPAYGPARPDRVGLRVRDMAGNLTRRTVRLR